jgi:hypothetical protein
MFNASLHRFIALLLLLTSFAKKCSLSLTLFGGSPIKAHGVMLPVKWVSYIDDRKMSAALKL